MAVTDISAACLEDEAPLTEILDMIQTRASAVAVTGSRIRDLAQPFPHNATVIHKIQWLRDLILVLAPKFVDMDYPYFDKTWVEFPKFFSANQLRDDPEHGLNVLPAQDSSFDNDSIEVYRKALADMVYWLEKFRYVFADKSFYDNTFKRNWDWHQTRDYTTWAYEYESNENGVAGQESTMAGLQGRMTGLSDDIGTRFISNSGHEVYFRQFDHRSKFYSYKDSWSNSKPLTLWEEIEHYFELTDVPHKLTTRNPTCFAPTLYWYIIPGGSRNSQLNEKIEFDHIAGTIEEWTTHTWGPNDEYSAIEYHVAEGGSDEQNTKLSFRNEWKQSWNRFTEGDDETTTTTETTINYSSDGQRSHTKTETETLSSSYYVGSNWINETNNAVANFGLVTMNANPGPRYEAGTIAPYSSLSWTVCEQNSLINPNVPSPTARYSGEDKFCFGVGSIGMLTVYGSTRWVPILDFKDFSTEVSQQNS